MTSLVGVYCKDGVVIGADSAATSDASGIRTVEQPFEKIEIIQDQVIVAGTGSVGLGQRFNAQIKALREGGHLKGSEFDVAKRITAEAIKDFHSTHVQPGQFGALVAYVSKSKPHLVEYDLKTLQPEFKTPKLWYCSMGSGQLITDPFLAFIREVFWHDGPPSLQDAVFAVTWTLDHAVQVNPGGVNGPVRIAVLEKSAGDYRAKLLSEAELAEHRTNIAAAKSALRDYQAVIQRGADAPPVPAAPPLS